MILAKLQREFLRPLAVAAAPIQLPDFSPEFIKSLVEGVDRQRDTNRQDGGMVHVSELSALCPRRSVLAVKDSVTLGTQPRSADRVNWALGRAAEHHVRGQLIRALDFQNVIGKWLCRCGFLEYSGLHDKARSCSRCGGAAEIYGEIDLVDSEAGVEGHPDMLLLVGGRIIVTEFKSMNKKDFDVLKEPEKNHLVQVGAYCKILAQGTIPVAPVVIVFYVCKDYSFRGSPYLEFHVNVAKMEWLQNILAIKWEEARKVRIALQTLRLPERIAACSNSNAPIAKKCEVCVSCFSRES